jgi:hypothetical protein
MIVEILDILSAFVPTNTDPPLVIDADAVLSFAVALQGLKPVSRRHSEVVQARSLCQHNYRAADVFPVHGLRTATPAASNSSTLRVTTVRS